ncbi:LytTR family DNA-binding domain-containing protein [Paenibacillus kribbensis]|uniref:LytR/AlgR family response regulator transcription factor n=1 Tax=Paenibacillus kribbensis TaxID=172713 RepID=UPI002DB92BF1|nr:LytTR family DNA-binding domain-containing protein [Paenibacillus kribbensis]MEC0233224.1 LytTR family DNA-binding domain-containing protein [Paenibacillus kribbensis]
MKVVICEDECYWRDALKASIFRWALNKNIELQCADFYSSQELIQYLNAHIDIDVVLLDISLSSEDIDGMTTAKYIRKMGNRVPIIFVTVDSARAIDGYLVEAMGFLKKPIDEKRLSLFLDRVVKQKKPERVFNIIAESTINSVRQSDIFFVEVNNHTIIYHTTKEEIHLRGTLNKVMQLLGCENFVQIHRSYVISKSKIYRIKITYPYSVDIFNGHEIINLPVSRNYINNLLEVYSDDVLE